MDVKLLNPLQLGAYVQANFEAYWQQANVRVEIESTWASDLAIALYYAKRYDDDKAIQETIDDGFEEWKTDFNMSSQLILAVNYLEWFCRDNFYYSEFGKFFERAYNSLLLQCEHVYSNIEMEELMSILD